MLSGRWYPADPGELRSTIDGMLAGVSRKNGLKNPLILILPHAGYAYSGNVAAAGYAVVKDMRPDIIMIIAPSHYRYFRGCSVMPVDYYETPLGTIRTDKRASQKLLEHPLFSESPEAHRREHAVEIHLPFIQRVFERQENLVILPVLVGELSAPEAEQVAAVLTKILGNRKSPLIIISSDFTHYGKGFGYMPFTFKRLPDTLSAIKKLDMGAVDFIIKKEPAGFARYVHETGITICGWNPILISLYMNSDRYRAGLLAYGTSADKTGDHSSIVSYGALAIEGSLHSPPQQPADSRKLPGLSDADRDFLIKTARGQIYSHLYRGQSVVISESRVPPGCRNNMGVFVTIRSGNRLRGCIGRVDNPEPLYRGVLDSAFNAAFRDPRFPPLRKDEFDGISIEISVLSTPVPVYSEDEVEVGRDGLIVEMGRHRGLLLPQVPVEWRWSREEFLINVCRKAGLPDYAWKHGAKLYSFRAEVFSEGTVPGGRHAR